MFYQQINGVILVHELTRPRCGVSATCKLAAVPAEAAPAIQEQMAWPHWLAALSVLLSNTGTQHAIICANYVLVVFTAAAAECNQIQPIGSTMNPKSCL